MKKLIFLFLYLLGVTSFSSEKPFHVSGTKYIIRPIFGLSTSSDLGELVLFKEFQRDPSHGKIGGIQAERYR
jgi:hypothetical protein